MVRNFPNEKTPLVPLYEECLVLSVEKVKWRENRERKNRKNVAAQFGAATKNYL